MTAPVSMPDALMLTYQQIREIYYAGTQRGSAEATSFEWGSSAPGKWHDDLTQAVYEILNDGRSYDEPGYQTWDCVEAWVVQGERAYASAIKAPAIEAEITRLQGGEGL